MNFLKGFGTFILSFLLFVSLTVFGVALMLQSTLLSPGFVKKQVDRLDVSSVLRDVIEEQVDEEIPTELSFFEAAIYDAFDAQEPWLKDQAHLTIDNGYDYLLGKTDTLSISVPLDDFTQDLKESLWQELDAELVVWLRDNIQTEMKPYIERNLQTYRPYLPTDLATLPDDQLHAYLDTYLDQMQAQLNTVGGSLVVSGLLETLVKPYFNDYYNEFIAEFPSELVADETTISTDAMEKLQLARQYIGYFRSGFYWLITFMVVLVAGIFLIHRNIADPSRALGIDLALYGVLELAGILIARRYFPTAYQMDIPESLHAWLAGMYHDVTGIMLWFSIGVLVIGAALIVVSFVFRKKEAEA